MLRKIIIGAVAVNFLFILSSVFMTADKYSVAPNAIAQNVSFGGGISVEVEEFLNLGGAVLKFDKDTQIPDGGDLFQYAEAVLNTTASYDFGSLKPVTNATNPSQILYMGGEKYYTVFMYPATSGIPYQITQTAGRIRGVSGPAQGKYIPDQAFLVVPAYVEGDRLSASDPAQGSIGGGSVGNARSAVSGVGNLIFESDGDATPAIVRATLALGGPDTDGRIRSCTGGINGAGTCLSPGVDYALSWVPILPSQPSGTYAGESDIVFTLSPQ